jgi:hypothetical protein
VNNSDPRNEIDSPLTVAPQIDTDPKTLPRPTGAMLSLVWAGLGPVFMAKAAHFGTGFAPMMIWLLSVPVIAAALIGATIYKVESYRNGSYGARAALWAVAIWPVATLVYVGIGFYLLIS